MDWDALRWVNVVLSASVAALMIAGAYARWREMPKWLQRVVPWVVLTYVLLAYGFGEVAASNDYVEPGLRVTLLSFNLLGLLLALAAIRLDRDGQARDDA